VSSIKDIIAAIYSQHFSYIDPFSEREHAIKAALLSAFESGRVYVPRGSSEPPSLPTRVYRKGEPSNIFEVIGLDEHGNFHLRDNSRNMSWWASPEVIKDGYISVTPELSDLLRL
jgi:hypothetical protein